LPYEVKEKLAKVARLSVMFCHTMLYMSEKWFLLLTAYIVPYMHITLLRFEYWEVMFNYFRWAFLSAGVFMFLYRKIFYYMQANNLSSDEGCEIILRECILPALQKKNKDQKCIPYNPT
jgi:hypothetical protein